MTLSSMLFPSRPNRKKPTFFIFHMVIVKYGSQKLFTQEVTDFRTLSTQDFPHPRHRVPKRKTAGSIVFPLAPDFLQALTARPPTAPPVGVTTHTSSISLAPPVGAARGAVGAPQPLSRPGMEPTDVEEIPVHSTCCATHP